MLLPQKCYIIINNLWPSRKKAKRWPFCCITLVILVIVVIQIWCVKTHIMHLVSSEEDRTLQTLTRDLGKPERGGSQTPSSWCIHEEEEQQQRVWDDTKRHTTAISIAATVISVYGITLNASKFKYHIIYSNPVLFFVVASSLKSMYFGLWKITVVWSWEVLYRPRERYANTFTT